LPLYKRYGRGSRVRKRVSYAEEAEGESESSSEPPSKRRLEPEEPGLRKRHALETRKSTRVRINTVAISSDSPEEEGSDDSDYSSSAGEEELAQMDLQLDQEDS